MYDAHLTVIDRIISAKKSQRNTALLFEVLQGPVKGKSGPGLVLLVLPNIPFCLSPFFYTGSSVPLHIHFRSFLLLVSFFCLQRSPSSRRSGPCSWSWPQVIYFIDGSHRLQQRALSAGHLSVRRSLERRSHALP